MNLQTRTCLRLWLSLTLLAPIVASAQQPNFVLILADDLGYTDISPFGSEINTPNIDQLAQDGLRFTDFYSAAPNCSPARTGLLTGRTPSRVGVYDYLAPDSPMHFPEEEITIAEMLKSVGYETCHVGKWHLSKWKKNKMIGPKPGAQGFDYWFAVDNNAVPSHKDPTNFERNGVMVGALKGYSCDLVVDEAIFQLCRPSIGSARDAVGRHLTGCELWPTCCEGVPVVDAGDNPFPALAT